MHNALRDQSVVPGMKIENIFDALEQGDHKTAHKIFTKDYEK